MTTKSKRPLTKKRGTKKTPTVIAEAKGIGNTNKKNKSEPIPEKGLPPKPEIMSKVASAHWDQLAPHLYSMGTLTVVDGSIFALYCEYYAMYQGAIAALNEEGAVLKNDNRNAYRNPQLDVFNRAAAEMEKYSTYFGLNPSHRAQIELPEGKNKEYNPFDEL